MKTTNAELIARAQGEEAFDRTHALPPGADTLSKAAVYELDCCLSDWYDNNPSQWGREV